MAANDIDLVHAACAGDTRAFEELVHRYDSQVLAIAARFGNSREDAKDIYQEVFMRVFRNLRTFRGQSAFPTWLYRIATNVCLTHHSKKKRDFVVQEQWGDDESGSALEIAAADPNTTPDRMTETSDLSKRIHRAVELLSPKQKLVFTLKHYNGYSLKEIALMMKCTEGTVKRYLFMASRRLRTLLWDYYEVTV